MLDRKFQLGGAGTVLGVLSGIGISFYWSFRRIMQHLDRYSNCDQKNDSE